MYKTCKDILDRYFVLIEEIPKEEWFGNPELNRLIGLYSLYNNSLVEAEKYGWIGVGCITYAENRLQEAQKVDLVEKGYNQ